MIAKDVRFSTAESAEGAERRIVGGRFFASVGWICLGELLWAGRPRSIYFCKACICWA